MSWSSDDIVSFKRLDVCGKYVSDEPFTDAKSVCQSSEGTSQVQGLELDVGDQAFSCFMSRMNAWELVEKGVGTVPTFPAPTTNGNGNRLHANRQIGNLDRSVAKSIGRSNTSTGWTRQRSLADRG